MSSIRMLDPIAVAKELRDTLVDKADPSVNYIKALDRLIAIADLSYDYLRKHPQGSPSPIAVQLMPFRDCYDSTQLNAAQTATVTHYMHVEAVVSECYGFQYFHSEDAEDPAAAEMAYMTGENFDRQCVGLYEFLAQTFHLMQQTGGRLEYEFGEVRASTMEQTSGAGYGDPITDDSVITHFGKHTTVGALRK